MTVRAGDDIERVREALTKFVPDGFRDEDGVWHEGPLRLEALAALGRLQGKLAAHEAVVAAYDAAVPHWRQLADAYAQVSEETKRHSAPMTKVAAACAALESRP